MIDAKWLQSHSCRKCEINAETKSLLHPELIRWPNLDKAMQNYYKG